MLSTVLLAVTFAQLGPGTGIVPPVSSDPGFGGMSTPMGSSTSLPSVDPARDRSPLSGSNGSTNSGASSSNDWSGSTGGTTGTTDSTSGGGTGTTTGTRTSGGTNSGGTMK
ncbi:MAG TPA: hypothetical protein VN903_00105 [Polyangia bacterium]|nr:hypothetical protein [Polyangia bacterium]